MLCKWCGMESATTDQCSWCHRVFSTAPVETAPPADAQAKTGREAFEEAPVAPETSASSGDETPVEEESAIAPWTLAPPAPAVPIKPATPASANDETEAARPIIGVRRPADRRDGAHRPAPGVPPGVSRTSRTETARSNTPAGNTVRTPAPGMPAATGVNRAGRDAATRPPVPARPAAAPRMATPTASPSAPSAPPTARPVPSSRPAVPAALTGGARALRSDTNAPVAGASATAAPPAARRNRVDAEVAEANVPSLGTFTPAQSKYYVGQLVDPVSGTHYDSETGIPTTEPLGSAVTSDGVPLSDAAVDAEPIEIAEEPDTPLPVLMRYLGAFAVILGLAALFTFANPANYVIPLLCAEFAGAMLLPVLRVAPWADEDAGDTVLFVLLTLTCGPVVALVIYGVISLLRQDANPGIVGCLAVALLARVTVDLARWAADSTIPITALLSPRQYAPFAEVGHFDLKAILINWSGLVALLGWYMASIFHHLDE